MQTQRVANHSFNIDSTHIQPFGSCNYKIKKQFFTEGDDQRCGNDTPLWVRQVNFDLVVHLLEIVQRERSRSDVYQASGINEKLVLLCNF